MKVSAMLAAVAASIALATAATAQSPGPAPTPAPAPEYAVPVEVVPLVKTKVKFVEVGFAAGEYVFATQTNVKDKSGPFSVDVLGATRSKKLVTVRYRFTKLDGEPLEAGMCSMMTKTWSGLWNTAENSLYTCTFPGRAPTGYALEALIPNIEAETGAMISMTVDNPDKYKVLKARLRYADALYEAVPTGFEPKREALHQRVATGYTITRDGKLVGRIDFPDYKGTIVDINGSYDRKSVLTAPKSDSDGRAAVIFFAGQLLALPEANSPALQAD